MAEIFLVTGCAGFIGFHLSERLLNLGYKVVGVDNLDPYYDVSLKKIRLSMLKKNEHFKFYKLDIVDGQKVERIFKDNLFSGVFNLAGQAGVRYSIVNPRVYFDSNVHGFFNILDSCRKFSVGRLVYASSSSVYGEQSDNSKPNELLSFYAASKKTNEVFAQSYSKSFGIKTAGLRFFSVYGPWGRPDMAYYLFTNNVVKGEPVKIFNRGEMFRDFTYIDDVVRGLVDCNTWLAKKESGYYAVYDLGYGKSIKVTELLLHIEKNMGMVARKEYVEKHVADVERTLSDTTLALKHFGFKAKVPFEVGIKSFFDWYKTFYKLKSKKGNRNKTKT